MQLFDAASLTDGALEQILSFLRAGGVIAFPTDTAYALGADPFNDAAVRRIFEIKGRAEMKPILVLVNSLEMAASVSLLPEKALSLARRFWPGPLTMILPALPSVPASVTAGSGTIGVRWPDTAFTQRLLAGFGKPITATSANRSGLPSAVTIPEVREQLGESVQLLIDGGELPARGGSTLIDLTETPARLLREGPIVEAELSDVLR
jgi:L-threonylcarbamoyladenylate synthase